MRFMSAEQDNSSWGEKLEKYVGYGIVVVVGVALLGLALGL